MKALPKITVAPNGARRTRADHPALPVTVAEIAQTAQNCHAVGAQGLHLHVRAADGTHSLDVGLYHEAIAEVTRLAPGMEIQVTTESADRYSVAEQLALLERLRPQAASISVREIARAPELAHRVYAVAQDAGTRVQHILYGAECYARLENWFEDGTVPLTMRDAIVVLGRYTPPTAGQPQDLDAMLAGLEKLALQVTVCAFGAQEQACLLAAAERGCDVRVGFENNLRAPGGHLWPDNASAVAGLSAALAAKLLEDQLCH